jgi:hypothetical protein
MWILTLTSFSSDPENEFAKSEWAEFMFETNEITNANESTEGLTTIELKSGYRTTIAMAWDDFKKEFPPKTIHINTRIAYESNYQVKN